ncbi:MAG: hypothetical protein DMF33_01155, partial [Verrucomicrobia bacterium]
MASDTDALQYMIIVRPICVGKANGLGHAAVSSSSRIRPAAKFFFEGDIKFFVKGVTYGPFKPDADGNYVGRPDQVDIDLAL